MLTLHGTSLVSLSKDASVHGVKQLVVRPEGPTYPAWTRAESSVHHRRPGARCHVATLENLCQISDSSQLLWKIIHG